jgi:predicted permease
VDNAVAVISKVLPVILLIFLGNILQRTGFLKQSTVEDLKKIIVNIGLPSLLFLAFTGTAFEARYLLIFFAVFLVCVIMLVFGGLYKKAARLDNDYVPALFSGFETGMMGYSLFVAVFGAENMFKIAIMDLGQVTFVFFVLVSYLQRKNGQTSNARQLLLSFIKSPVILAIIIGSLSGTFGVITAIEQLPVFSSVLEAIKLLSNLTSPIICIIIGYELHVSLHALKGPLLAALTRLAILLAIAFALNKILIGGILQLDRSYEIALYTLFLLPPPFVVPIYMKESNGKDRDFILNSISISILLSLAAFLILILIV